MDIVIEMMYASKREHYETLKNELFSAYDTKHPFRCYFVKNWDNIAPTWCSYHRNVVPCLGNQTNNRLESHWPNLKLVLQSNITITRWLRTLVILQRQ